MKTTGKLGLAVLLVLAFAATGDQRADGREAFGFTFEDINPRSATFGTRVALSELYAERGVALQFTASWCQFCRAEMPTLQQAHAGKELPIVFVGADEFDGPKPLLKVAARAQLTAPLLYVPEEQVARIEKHYGYTVLPATYLIDKTGKILLVHQGTMAPGKLVPKIESVLGL